MGHGEPATGNTSTFATASTPEDVHLWGMNSINDTEWTNPASYPVAQLRALGAKVVRGQLDMVNGDWDGYVGAMTYPLTLKARGNVEAWVKAMRGVGIQPLIVCTFTTLQDTPTMVAAMTTLVSDNPGVWWEWGNELEYQAQGITVATYVAQFRSIVAAIAAADPTAKIGPAPVENITKGDQGWTNEAARSAAGLFSIPFHFLSHHNYGNTAAICEALIAPWIAQCKTWGYSGPHWDTESGWNTSQTTPADQAVECVAFFGSAAVQALPVALAYELLDDDSMDWGWMSSGYVPKPVYTAFATRS